MNSVERRKAYRWILKRRREKKKSLYKLAIGTVIDKTIAVYLFFFGILGLVIVHGVINDYINQYGAFLEQIQWSLFGVAFVPFYRVIVKSVVDPGLRFTTTDYHLSILPFSKKELLYSILVRQWINLGIIFGIFTCIALYLLPFSWMGILGTGVTVWLSFSIALLWQWYLFHKSWYMKILLFIGLGIFVSLATTLLFSGILNLPTIVVISLFSGVIVALILSRFSKNIDWERAASINDSKVWNLWLVKLMTRVDVKPQRRYTFWGKWSQRKKKRRPFPYQGRVIYGKLWKPYFVTQQDILLQSIFTVVTLLALIGRINLPFLGGSLVISVFVWSKMASSIFRENFRQPLMYMIPWKMDEWMKSFIKWNRFPVFLFSLIVFVVTIFSFPFTWEALLIVLYLFLWMEKCTKNELEYVEGLLSKNPKSISVYRFPLSIIGYGLLGMSGVYPITALAGIVLVFVDKKF